MAVIYYNIYFLLCLCFAISFAYEKKSRSGERLYDLYILIVIFSLSIFCAIRWDTPDTLQYYYYYLETPSLWSIYSDVSNGKWFFSIEPLFHILMSLVKTFHGSFGFFLFIITFTSLCIVYQAYKNYSLRADLAFIVYLSLSFIFLYFVQIRQGVSIALTLWSISCFYSKKKLIGFFLLILSLLIHVSAIAVFPVLLLMRVVNLKLLIILTPVLVVLFNALNIVPKLFIELAKLVNFPLLSTKIDLYFISGVKEHTVSLFSVINILTICIVIFIACNRKKFITYFESNRLYVWSQFYTCCSVIVYNMFPLAQDVGSRFYKQLNVFMPLQIAFILDAVVVSKYKQINIIFRVLIILSILTIFYREAFNFEVY